MSKLIKDNIVGSVMVAVVIGWLGFVSIGVVMGKEATATLAGRVFAIEQMQEAILKQTLDMRTSNDAAHRQILDALLNKK